MHKSLPRKAWAYSGLRQDYIRKTGTEWLERNKPQLIAEHGEKWVARNAERLIRTQGIDPELWEDPTSTGHEWYYDRPAAHREAEAEFDRQRFQETIERVRQLKREVGLLDLLTPFERRRIEQRRARQGAHA